MKPDKRATVAALIDLLVENQVIVELKSVTRLPDVVLAQITSYLKATGLKRTLLINLAG